jgi:hypothetical protein
MAILLYLWPLRFVAVVVLGSPAADTFYERGKPPVEHPFSVRTGDALPKRAIARAETGPGRGCQKNI